MNAKLLDAHIYVCRRTVLDLLAQRKPRDLDSLKEQIVPWLAKGSWQRGLSEQWSSSKRPLPAPEGQLLIPQS